MTISPAPARGVTAVLGPTNTGKTHLAIERMLGHESGVIGLPLRLLAREVYDRVVARTSPADVALITGEEKIKPPRARYWVCTVEAMPRDVDAAFVAIDEVQLSSDPDRGHVFTERLLRARGTQETLFLGSDTMRGVISDIMPGANFVARPRLSKLSYAGQKKISRLPRRTAIVAFSAADVYAIAELIRRQRGGAAVVMGALSPRTRNAQVALYQSEEVDFLVATDAIGMGLNLDVNHVAFAATRKFDGARMRDLTLSEMAQIAGRAGRHLNDGTFGVTGDTEAFEQETIDALENHAFDPVKVLQWRNSALDFSSIHALRHALDLAPDHSRLVRARSADDVIALEAALRDPDVARMAMSPAAIRQLWDVCQVPDYPKVSHTEHAELVCELYKYLLSDNGQVPEEWFAGRVSQADRTDGDIDTLASRLAHMRTWTFIANQSGWLADAEAWQDKTRAIEDKLSDALHEQLTQRFVDRRTSTLMRTLRDSDDPFAEIGEDGSIHVEKHFVGRLVGLRYTPDASTDGGIDAKASRNAASRVLARELTMRARRIASAKPDAITFNDAGRVLWREQEIAQLAAGDTPLKPRVILLSDEHLSGPDAEKIQARLDSWIAALVDERAKPVVLLSKAEDTAGIARGIAFQLVEQFGVLKRQDVSGDVRSMDQTSRGQLRRYGVRFGAFNIHFPAMLKPASTRLLTLLWRLARAQEEPAVMDFAAPRAGLTSTLADPAVPEAFYRVAGYHVCGPRAVRIDMLERLADMIRPLASWRAKEGDASTPPRGATGDGGFTVQPEMMSILGCSAENVGDVLRALGFRLDRRQLPAKTQRAAEKKSHDIGAAAVDASAGAPNVQSDGAAADPVATAAVAGTQDGGTPAAQPVQPGQNIVEDAPADGQAGNEVQADGDDHAHTQTASPAGADKTTAGDADASAAADDTPDFIDIWRPARHETHRGRNRSRQAAARRRQGGGEATSGAVAASAEGSEEEKTAGSRRDRRGAAGQSRKTGRGGNQAGGERARGEKNQRSEGRGGRAQPRHGKGSGGGPKGNRRPMTVSAGPPRKGKAQADPDSPFAALGELKQKLEQKSSENNTDQA
ncbi:MAG: helicase-related protein [Pseudomonadota bacterium]